jgi:hypothetical protein
MMMMTTAWHAVASLEHDTFTLVRAALRAYSCGVCMSSVTIEWVGVDSLLYLLACALQYRYINNMWRHNCQLVKTHIAADVKSGHVFVLPKLP